MRANWSKLKVERELEQLNLFKNCFQEICHADISLIEKDPPDGLICYNNKKIGIELTQLIWDDDKNKYNKKEQESLRNVIIDIAQHKYEKLNLPPIQVNISFKDQYGLAYPANENKLNSSDKEILSDYLVEIIKENIPLEERCMFEIPSYDNYGNELLNPKIDSICISRFPALKINSWSADGGGVIPELTHDKLNYIIQKKAKRISSYNHLYDELWLLIVEDWEGISGYFDFTNFENKMQLQFQTDFNRVFILRSKKKIVLELKIK